MKNISQSIILIILISVSSFSNIAHSSNLLDQKISEFEKKLSKIQPELKNSIISVSGQRYKFSYGSKNITKQSQFYIGSLSKQITAYMFIKTLQQQYPKVDLKLLLQQKLSETFPSSLLLKQLNKYWINEVTLLDLLTHTSGLSDYIIFYEHEFKKPEALNIPIDPVEILQVITFNSLKPYHYSNSNYFLLGKLLEEMQCKSYEQIFNIMVKLPAYLTSSYAPAQGNYHRFKGDKEYKKLVENLNDRIFFDFANTLGTGGIISTAEDLLKWNNYFHHILDFKLRDILLTKYFYDEDDDAINLGLTSSKTNIGEYIGFQGGLDSYRSFLCFYPDHNLNIVILSNNQKDFELLLDSFRSVFLE